MFHEHRPSVLPHKLAKFFLSTKRPFLFPIKSKVLVRPEMMCTQGWFDYDWFYSLKTLAHITS